MNMSFDISIVHWAAAECDRQKSGELSVGHLCDAWLYLSTQPDKRITSDTILTLGAFVEPVVNAKGFRTLPVHFTNGDVISASNIAYQVNNLCEYSNVLSPLQWYTEFEKIHPFLDGNGRVGSLMFNFLSDTLDEPVTPPDVFSNSSPPCSLER
jgi:hypothetical protein